MFSLRSSRYVNYFLKQNQFSYCLNAQNKATIHLNAILLRNNKEDIPSENFEDKPKLDDGVWIGPPHPVSQLRLKVFPESKNLTKEERAFYSQCKKTQEWNHQYWEAHNKDFHESRILFMDKVAKEKNLTRDEVAQSDDMSLFYEHFLKRNYSKHITYNWNWYKKNFELLYLNAKVNFSKFKKNFTS